MGDPLASVDDVADLWRPLTDSELSRVENLIAKASGLFRQATKQTVDERIALHTSDPTNPRALDPGVVATVVAGVVARFLKNPDGATSVSETAGPFAKQMSYGDRTGDNTRGVMTVTLEDLAGLAPHDGGVGSARVDVTAALRRGQRAAYPDRVEDYYGWPGPRVAPDSWRLW